MTKITELAHMIRSRKVSHHAFEVDVIFRDPSAYKKTVDAGVLTKDIVAKLYGVPESDIISFEMFDTGNSIHFTVFRPSRRASGDPGETDVSGGLQYFPIIEIDVP